MDIHGYIRVWVSDFSHLVDIMLAHLLIKLNIYMLCFSLSVIFTLYFFLFVLLSQINNH